MPPDVDQAELELDKSALESFLASARKLFPPDKRFERLFPESSNRAATLAIDSHIFDITNLIDEVVGTLSRSVISLKSKRNNEAAINTLPEEILKDIFNIAGEGGYDHRCITRISWTCAVWRDICLSTSSQSLWRRIDLTSVPLPIADLFITRNKTIPFDLTVINGGSHPAYEAFCIAQKDFIRVLNMQLTIPTTSFSLRKLESQLLEVLSLHFLQGGTKPPDNHRIMDIFGTCPKLQHLTLDGIFLPSVSVAYDHLQTLNITLPSVVPDSLDIISILTRSSSLKVLHLSVWSRYSIFGNVTRMKAELIPLLQLQHLTLELPAADILHILSAITTGPHVSLRLKNTSDWDSDLLPLDSRCLPCLSSTVKLCIDREGRKIEMYRSLDPDSNMSEELFLVYTASTPNVFSISSLMYLTLNMHAVKELVFVDTTDQDQKLDAGLLITFLRLVSLADLRRLKLHSCRSNIYQLFAIHAQHAQPRLCHELEALYLESMPIDTDSIQTICSSLAPHVRSILVSKCSFDQTEEKAMSILDMITTIDFQVMDSRFLEPQSIIPTYEAPSEPINIAESSSTDIEPSPSLLIPPRALTKKALKKKKRNKDKE